MPRVVVLATDFSDAARRALGLVARLASSAPTEVTVVHVLSDSGVSSLLGGITTPTSTVAERMTAARLALDSWVDRLLRCGVRATGCVLVGPLAGSLLALCSELGASLLVVGTTPGTGLHNVLTGSVSRRVLADARLPVMLVPGRVRRGRKGAA